MVILLGIGIGICLFLNGFGLVKFRDRIDGNINLLQSVRGRIEKECKVTAPEACAVLAGAGMVTTSGRSTTMGNTTYCYGPNGAPVGSATRTGW